MSKAARDGVHGREVWKTDGTEAGTVLVKDLSAVGAYYSPSSLTDVGGTLFFQATGEDATSVRELWRSDGTAAGTTLVKDISTYSSSAHSYLTNVGGTLYFSAWDNEHGRELWRSDGTAAGTTLVSDINPGVTSSYPRDLTDVNGRLFFTADDGAYGRELWTLAGAGVVSATSRWDPGRRPSSRVSSTSGALGSRLVM